MIKIKNKKGKKTFGNISEECRIKIIKGLRKLKREKKLSRGVYRAYKKDINSQEV